MVASMRTLKLIFLALTVLALAAAPPSSPVTWALTGVTMSDGAVAQGSFTYNAGTNTFSNISISTTGGTVFPGAAYTAVDPSQVGSVDNFGVEFVPNPGLANFTGTPVLVLIFSPPLTNGGGTSSLINGIVASYETTCANAACTGPSLTTRTFAAGNVTTTPPQTAAPVPALSSIGFAGLAILLAGSSTLKLRRRTL
jgi:hypothetical protein